MNKNSIYQNQCPELRELFCKAHSSDRVAVVALDFARDKHLVLICNALGEQLLKPFPVHNNRAGIDHLNQQIRQTIKRRRIHPTHVLVGGEDDPHYVKNFLWALHAHWLVLRVNAFKAKKQRENIQASSDKLDLLGIAKMLLNREAAVVFTTGGLSDSHERYNALKVLGRTRDSLVRDQTRLSNRIHSHVRILFPGFLDESRANPISPFSDACLNLMHKSDFTATRYARKKNTSLARTLKKLRLRNSQEKASQLIARARTALAPAPHMVQAHQDSLGCLVAGYLAVKQNAAQLERRQISHLAGTPGALLTSISGIGMITASALSGELGPPEQLGCRAQMASYSGIIPRTKQSGGPDSPSKILRVGHHCNHRLKNHVVRAATAIGQRFGPPELQEHWKELQEKGQHAAFIYARRLLSTSKAIMNNGTIWLPKSLRGGATAGEAGAREYRLQMFRYLQEMWPRLRSKWAAHQALESAFAPENPLGQWREVIVQLYRIELPLEELPVSLKEESELAPADH